MDFGGQVSAKEREAPLVVDLQQIGDFPLGKNGVFRSGVKNEVKGKYPVEHDRHNHESIDIGERYFDALPLL